MIDARLVSDETLDSLDVVSEIVDIDISSPPVVTFRLETSQGVPIIGIVPFWEDSNRYIRFTLCKLVAGMDGNPDSWVSYTRDANTNAPDYDTGQSVVDNEDGTYVFTFNTDVANVPGVPYEPNLTHRLAGQLGSRSVPIEAQNMVDDFVPNGGALPLRRDIATMDACNDCHDGLVFHGRRFVHEYCTNCHNPDLAEGEGNMSFMIHRIHSAGSFEILDDAIDYSEVTYPQDVINCRKCHTADNPDTPQGDNWKNQISKEACSGCHDVFGEDKDPQHPLVPDPENSACSNCHNALQMEAVHRTANATPNNPLLLEDQVEIRYELISAAVDNGDVTVEFKIYVDDVVTDVLNLPDELALPGRYPGFVLAWAEMQDGIMAPKDFTNSGGAGGQPIRVDLDDLSPIAEDASIGTLSWDGEMNTAVISGEESVFPDGGMMRTVGLQGYFRQDVDADGLPEDPGYEYALHAVSRTITVDGDTPRRRIVSNTKCAQCHEWFEGHGGNRVFDEYFDEEAPEGSVGGVTICLTCHVPNLTSSGRTADLEAPEDAQNFKDMIHGIHASGFRTRAYVHVRNFRGSNNVYDWSHVTFPAEEGTRNCYLCHEDGTIELPGEGTLPTNVRSTLEVDGQDATTDDFDTAWDGVPNETDWINTPVASSCFYCHTSTDAFAHMVQNGALLSVPNSPDYWANRFDFGTTIESCATCHGEGKIVDINEVHKGD